MNRIILIGNGFDLAHDLKTNYSDFITYYLLTSIKNFNKLGNYNDPLLEIKTKFIGNNRKIPEPETIDKIIEIIDYLSNSDNYITCKIKSKFLAKTLKRLSDIKWVDLENIYFENLLELRYSSGFNFPKVLELNKEFDFLKSKLEEYLTQIQQQNQNRIIEQYVEIFTEFIQSNEIVTKKIENQLPENLLFLNFNYTNTTNLYFEFCNKIIPTHINYIHGELNSNSNPIVFGFGDEYNKEYLKFEDLNNKSLFTHIKSFAYFKTSNYHELIKFLELDDFQVYVMGHSLGISDRTMLKAIFEHVSCKSIKIFYRQLNDSINDYIEKTFAISSHFSDKGIMRKKIIPYNLSIPMPNFDL